MTLESLGDRIVMDASPAVPPPTDPTVTVVVSPPADPSTPLTVTSSSSDPSNNAITLPVIDADNVPVDQIDAQIAKLEEMIARAQQRITAINTDIATIQASYPGLFESLADAIRKRDEAFAKWQAADSALMSAEAVEKGFVDRGDTTSAAYIAAVAASAKARTDTVVALTEYGTRRDAANEAEFRILEKTFRVTALEQAKATLEVLIQEAQSLINKLRMRKAAADPVGRDVAQVSGA